MYIEENYTEYDHSIGAYSKLSTRDRCWLTPDIGRATYIVQFSLMHHL